MPHIYFICSMQMPVSICLLSRLTLQRYSHLQHRLRVQIQMHSLTLHLLHVLAAMPQPVIWEKNRGDLAKDTEKRDELCTLQSLTGHLLRRCLWSLGSTASPVHLSHWTVSTEHPKTSAHLNTFPPLHMQEYPKLNYVSLTPGIPSSLLACNKSPIS